MYAPAQHDEITGLVNYIDQQLDAIRTSAYGLTEEQARATPCRSALSVRGIIWHIVWVMRSATSRLEQGPQLGQITEEDAAAFFGSFTPAPWYGRLEPESIRLRYLVVHQVEELARHAGHADIIREQLDGSLVPALVLSREGAPANEFFAPYEPRPGTIVA